MQGWPEPHIYSVHTVFLAGKSPNIRSYTVHIHGSGQPSVYAPCTYAHTPAAYLPLPHHIFWNCKVVALVLMDLVVLLLLLLLMCAWIKGQNQLLQCRQACKEAHILYAA